MSNRPLGVIGPRLRVHLASGLLLFLFASGMAHADVCMVTTSGTPSGAGTWASPMNLQTALAALACSEIWVEAGTYATGSPRTNTFSIRPGVAVYGGFAGTETLRSQRNTSTLDTTLSGNTGVANAGSYHVVTLDGTTAAGNITATTVLDGFTVTKGNAVPDGGGVYCNGAGTGHECSPTLHFLEISHNTATGGGAGMYDSATSGGTSNPALSNVSIRLNTATGNGGGMFNNASGDGSVSSPMLSDVTFETNEAYGNGGAIYNLAAGVGATSSPSLGRVLIYANESGGSNSAGGGMMDYATSGGISSPSLTDVTFLQNNSAYWGGAMFSSAGGGTSSPTLNDVTFDGNTAYTAGGAMFEYSSGANSVASPILGNVTFVSNHLTAYKAGDGGAIYNLATSSGTSSPILHNVSLLQNMATRNGGAIYNTYDSTATNQMSLVNVILWDDTAPNGTGPEIYNETGTLTGIDHSIVAGGCPSGGTCTNVSANDPLLTSYGNNGGFTNTLLPGMGSSAIDSGDDATCGATPVNGFDQRGISRPVGPDCDIGAVEMVPGLIFADGFDH